MSKNRKNSLARVSESFRREIRDIQIQRMKEIDIKYPKPIGTEKLSDGIVRCSEWNIIKRKLLREPRKEDLGVE